MVRDAVGADMELILDVHTRLELPEATWLCRELEPLHPLFVEDPLRCETPPDGPGLGVEFDERAALTHPPQWIEPPHLNRGDGSFTNW